MKVIRETPDAINKPLTILGVGIIALGVFLLLGMFLSRHTGLRWAFYIVIGLCSLAKVATNKDPNFFRVGYILLFSKTVYDPIQREHFEVEIVD